MRNVQELWDMINIERLKDLTLGFLSIPSPTGDELAFAEHLAECLKSISMEVELSCTFPRSPNVIGRCCFGKPGKVLEFDGHLDTVNFPHAKPEYRNGRIFGRGACDMKGALACMAEAACVLIQAKPALAGELMISGHSRHEMPEGHNEPLDDMIEKGQFGNAVIIGECGSSKLPTKGLGMFIFDIQVERRGEVMHEFKGRNIPNPIAFGNRIITALSEYADGLDSGSLFIGQVHSGDFYNRVPRVWRVQGTRRYPPPKKGDDVRKEFEEILGFTREFEAQGIKTRIKIDQAADSFSVEANERIVSCLKDAYKTVHGKVLEEETAIITGNAPWFINKAGVPCLYHGLDQSSAHADVEYADIEEMVKLTRTYILTALSYLEEKG